MTRLTTIQTSFASGEIDPCLRAQTNLKLYNEGAFRLRNVARLSTGGVETRPPTLDLAGLPSLSRLVDFEFSNDQRYVAAFFEGGVRIYDEAGTLLTALGGAPWTEAQLFEMSYSQNADVMTLTHNAFLWDLTRTGPTSFVLAAAAFEVAQSNLKTYQPFYKFASDGVTITPSANSGAGVTLQASGTDGWGGFVAGHVGQRFRLFDNEVEITAVTDADTAVATVLGQLRGKLDLDPFRTKKGSGEVEVLHLYHGLTTGASVTLDGANDVAGITGAQLTGSFVITVVDELRYTIASGGTATESEDGGGPNVTFTQAGTAVRDWREPSINAIRGYPNTVCYHQQRKWYAGTPSQPDGFFGSNSLMFARFDVGKGYDGDSVQGAAGLESISSIRHIISNGDLQIFTATAEGVFRTRADEPITPSNMRLVGASGAGCGYVMPQVFDGATLFVQENGLSVHELAFSQQMGRYLATPVSAIAGHLLTSGIRDCAVTPGSTSRAEQYAFFPVEAGGVAVFHSMRAENIAGWTFWELGAGRVRSVCSVGAYVFFCVERDDGSFRLYRTVSGKQWLLDGAVEHVAGAPQTDWTLDARVRGRNVGLYSERGYHGEILVPADGEISISLAVETLAAGDPYYMDIETVVPRADMPAGSRDRMIKRIVQAVIEFEDTVSAIVDGAPIRLRQIGADPSIAPEPFSGSYSFRRLGYSRNPTITIGQQEPTFARVLGLTMEVQV